MSKKYPPYHNPYICPTPVTRFSHPLTAQPRNPPMQGSIFHHLQIDLNRPSFSLFEVHDPSLGLSHFGFWQSKIGTLTPCFFVSRRPPPARKTSPARRLPELLAGAAGFEPRGLRGAQLGGQGGDQALEQTTRRRGGRETFDKATTVVGEAPVVVRMGLLTHINPGLPAKEARGQ